MTKGRILHLSLTDPQFDTRVKRSVAAASSAGWESELLAPASGITKTPMTKTRKLKMASGFLAGGLIGQEMAERVFWQLSPHRDMLDAALRSEPEIVHAHDWDALVIGAKVASRKGAKLVYDSHEYAPGMHHERLLWRHTMSRTIRKLEAKHIHAADQIVTVSPGIAAALQKTHGLSRKPHVVRNLPVFQMPPEKSGNTKGRRVLHYHGILADGRGIGTLIEVLAHLPPSYQLELTGPERQRGFLARMNTAAVKLGVSDRMTIFREVSSERLVALASKTDFGFCLLSGNNPHYRNALPNKLFEYIMAGQFVIVSGSKDMADIVNKYRAGLVADSLSPRELAQAIIAISGASLKTTRQRNLKTAQTLCWENEQALLTGIYEKLL